MQEQWEGDGDIPLLGPEWKEIPGEGEGAGEGEGEQGGAKSGATKGPVNPAPMASCMPFRRLINLVRSIYYDAPRGRRECFLAIFTVSSLVISWLVLYLSGVGVHSWPHDKIVHSAPSKPSKKEYRE